MKKIVILIMLGLLALQVQPAYAAPKQDSRKIDWVGSSPKLSSANAKSISTWIQNYSNRVSDAKCVGYFSKGSSEVQKKLALARAQNTCANIKKNYASVSVKSLVEITSDKRNIQRTLILLSLVEDLPENYGIAAQPENSCKITSTGAIWNTVGFPLNLRRHNSEVWNPLKSIGKIRAIVIPVDFDLYRGTDVPSEYVAETLKQTANFYQKMSYGASQIEFTTIPKWLRMAKTADSYGIGTWNTGVFKNYYIDALKIASDNYETAGYDFAVVVAPKEVPIGVITPGPAFPEPVATPDGIMPLGAATGSLGAGDSGFRWLAHEIGHLYGLVDLYDVSGTVAGLNNRHTHFGWWDIMSMNWSQFSLEMNSWFRFQLGWLKSQDFVCANEASLTDTGQNIFDLSGTAGVRALFIKISSSKVLVLERRSVTGFTVDSPMSTGILIYVVDGDVSSDKAPVELLKGPDTRVGDASISGAALKLGQSIDYGNLHISISGSNANSSFIRIVRK